MLTANQPDQQTSCWERFKNRPILIGGLTVGGLGAIIVCCVGPAAIGAAIGGGSSAGATAEIGAGQVLQL